MENFVPLKDTYDSLTFDSYDHIPTLETVYEKWKSCLYQVSKGKSNMKHMKYVLNDKELIQVFIFLFL